MGGGSVLDYFGSLGNPHISPQDVWAVFQMSFSLVELECASAVNAKRPAFSRLCRHREDS